MMLIDARIHGLACLDGMGLPNVCIVGGGPAGITLALSLAERSDIQVLLLEAGGIAFDAVTQRLYAGEVHGDRHPPPLRSRFSALGGTSHLWAGWCRPLDSFDMEAREWLPGAQWPLEPADLIQYYSRASSILGLRWDSFAANPAAIAPIVDDAIVHPLFQINRLNFGQHFLQRLVSASNLAVVLNCPVRRLVASSDGSGRVNIEAGSLSGGGSGAHDAIETIAAGSVVLACGGLENARLLLLSGDCPERAIGNQNDQVGRNFCEHGFTDPGWFVPACESFSMNYYFPAIDSSAVAQVRPVITLAAHAKVTARLQNAALFFYPEYEAHATFAHPAVKAALDYWESIKGRGVPMERLDLMRTALSAPHRLAHALLRRAMPPKICRQWRLRMYFECAPRPGNRIRLGDDRDALGRQRLELNWHIGEEDFSSAIRTCTLVDEALRRQGQGHLLFSTHHSSWRAATEAGKHPMGGTRMGTDPTVSVVDADCRVHGTSNLYVAGSSVFPSAGYANPTLTIVALALRLADHIHAVELGHK